MGYITLAVLILTAIALIFGTLFGLGRGLNRSLLRLGLIVVSIILAIALRGVLVDVVMGINVGEGTLKETFAEMLTSGDGGLPESVQNLVFTLVELIIGLLVFVVLFFGLRLITWMLAYPFLKKIVPTGANKRKGWGALVGLVQGIVIAFVVLSPISGIVVQVDKISQIEINGEKVLEVPKELGINEYASSPVGKVYDTTGGWFFDVITTTKDEEGKTVSVSDACDIIVAVSGLAGSVEELSESVEIMTEESSTPTQRVDAMKTAGEKMTEIGNQLDALSDDAKVLIDDLLVDVQEMIGGEENSGDADNIFADLSLENLNLTSAGKALTGIGTYIEKTDESFDNTQAVTAQEVSDIVNGFADNTFILDMMTSESETPTLISVEEEHASLFESAISATDLSTEHKTALRQLFGLTE